METVTEFKLIVFSIAFPINKSTKNNIEVVNNLSAIVVKFVSENLNSVNKFITKFNPIGETSKTKLILFFIKFNFRLHFYTMKKRLFILF